MYLAHLAIILLAFVQSAASIFETEIAPGEGRPIYAGSLDEVQLSEAPSSASEMRTVKIWYGQILTYDETRYVTTAPGRIVVLLPSQVEGRMIGPVRRLSAQDYSSDKFAQVKIETKPGANIEYLQTRAETTCFVRIGKDVVNASPCPAIDTSAFKVEVQPQTELWIHVVLDRSTGWLRVAGARIKEVGRQGVSYENH